MRESIVETYAERKMKEEGGLLLKFISPTENGVPDRLLLHPSLKKTTFLELKAPGKKMRELQEEVAGELSKMGADVFVCDTKKAVDGLFEALFRTKDKKELDKFRPEKGNTQKTMSAFHADRIRKIGN